MTTTVGAVAIRRRMPLDELVACMTQPGFVARFGRLPLRSTGSGHVEPQILALESTRSSYVRRWRRHARRCPTCGAVFRYLGFSLK